MTAIKVDNEKMKWTIRKIGVGGLFGYYGKFVKRSFGSMTFYATRRNNYVLVTMTDDRKIIITPDDPDEFTHNFNALIGTISE